MIALDTNLIVRLLTRDDEAQAQLAAGVMAAGRLWLAKTVLLETEWVLRYTYELSRDTIGDSFWSLLGYRELVVEDEAAVIKALSWYGSGVDFADALHLASSAEAERFFTFDRMLARRAAKAGAYPAVHCLTLSEAK